VLAVTKKRIFRYLVAPRGTEAIGSMCIWGGTMKSAVVKHSIVIDGHKTSVSLEDAFWGGLREIAHVQRVTLSKLVANIDETRRQGNLSSAIRLFVLEHTRNGDRRETVSAGVRALT
jgi:predicted DNA-binding ribbon-helix-helix protein